MDSSSLLPSWIRPPSDSLPSGWHAVQLKDITTIVGGGRLGLTKERHYRTSGYPAFSAAGQDGYVEKAEFERTDAVILSAIGANCGRCFLAEGTWTTLANVQAILTGPEVSARFLHYRVNRDTYWPRSGSAQPFIKPNDIGKCWICLPPHPEQWRIAEILDTLDEAIRRTEHIIAKLKHIKQGLLHDLLTRGIDENGELRDPARHPEQFKVSPLGLVPKAWKVTNLSSLYSEPSRNGLYKPAKFHGRGPLMVQMGGIFSGFFASTDVASRVEVTPSELGTYGLRDGDLLFARRSLVLEGAGKCALVGVLPEPTTLSPLLSEFGSTNRA